MGSSMLVATANVLRDLDAQAAGTVVDGLLEHRPDLVGLQECSLKRYPVLRRRGRVAFLPGPVGALRAGRSGYLWLMPLTGGCVVGVRTDRFEPLAAGSRLLSGPGRADRGARDLPVRPPRVASVVTLQDRQGGGTVTFVVYHLMPAVQGRDGRYRADRPFLVGAHRQEARALNRIVQEHQALGHVVYACGDSNFDGFRIDGLRSAWTGTREQGGTFGRRRIDDVHGPGAVESVTLLTNASDHKALLVEVPPPAPTIGP